MSASPASSTLPKAGVREWIGLGILTLPALLLAVDLTVLHLALPHIVADLGPSSTQQLWILDIYGFMIAGFLITMGTLGDRIGRRRLLLVGAACFAAASAVAAYAPSPELLIAARALLGIAGATLMPSTLSLIRNMFQDPEQRGLAIAIWSAGLVGGTAVGPIVGGSLLQWFWWGSVFLMAVPVMVMLLVTAPFMLPEYRAPSPGRIDLMSVALSLAGILPVVYAFKDAAKDGWQATTVAALLAGVLFGWLFVRRQSRLDSPLMDLTLFRLRVFTVGLGSMLLGALAMGAFLLLLAQYLQVVQGMTPVGAGLWMAPFAAATVIGSLTAPLVAARLGSRRAIAGGLVVAAVGFALFAQAAPESGLVPVIAGSVMVGFGLSPLMVRVTTLVVSSAPEERSGSAASMSETCQELGVSLGIATLGALGTAVYRTLIAGTLPEDVPMTAAEAARDSLSGAAAAAENLPADVAVELMAAAADAFTAGLATVGYTSAVLAFALAVLTALYLTSDHGAARENAPDHEAPEPRGSGERHRNGKTENTPEKKEKDRNV